MILSHKHKFIYIKTIKTASSSIEAALTWHCGPSDIVTPARQDLMEARKDQMAQNYRLVHPAVPKRPLLKRILRRPERRYHPSIGYYEHMPAWRVREYVGEEIWSSYYKFSFERNPWDRQVSFYLYKNRNKKRATTFANYLKNKSRAYIENFDLYSNKDGEIMLDFVGRYENLTEDLRIVKLNTGLPEELCLPNINATGRRRNYRDYYVENTREIVGDWYAREIEYFGYRF